MAHPHPPHITNKEKAERTKPFEYDTDPCLFFESSHVLYFMAGIFGAVVITFLIYLLIGIDTSAEKGKSPFPKDPFFGKTFKDTIALDKITEDLPSRNKGDVIVTSSVEIIGHFLRSDINIKANFPTSLMHIIDPNLVAHSEDDFELATSVNSLHQRLIMRRLGTTATKFSFPLEFRDFQLTSQEKCACSSVLINKSFMSVKIITFRHRMSVGDKMESIRRNQSFDLSSLPAIPKTGIINATKTNTVTHRYALAEAEYQHTEIVKLIPPTNPASLTSSQSSNPVNQLICYLRVLTTDDSDSSTVDVACSSPLSLDETPKPSPSSCRHISREIKDFGMRNIPDTIISIFFCH